MANRTSRHQKPATPLGADTIVQTIQTLLQVFTLGATVVLAIHQVQVSRDLEEIKGRIERSQTIFTRRIDAQTHLLVAFGDIGSWPIYGFDMDAPWSKKKYLERLSDLLSRVERLKEALAGFLPITPPAARQKVDDALRGLRGMEEMIWGQQGMLSPDYMPKQSPQYHESWSVIMQTKSRTQDALRDASALLQQYIDREAGDADLSGVEAGVQTSPELADCSRLRPEDDGDADHDGVRNCDDICPWPGTAEKRGCW